MTAPDLAQDPPEHLGGREEAVPGYHPALVGRAGGVVDGRGRVGIVSEALKLEGELKGVGRVMFPIEAKKATGSPVLILSFLDLFLSDLAGQLHKENKNG